MNSENLPAQDQEADNPWRTSLNRLLRDAAAHPERWDFFELIRSVDKLFAQLPRTGYADSVQQEKLRFGQSPSLRPNLPHLDRVELTPHQATEAALRVFFLGFCGLDGPLPLELTSEVYQRTYNSGDPALTCFLDIINHRFISLMYRAVTTSSEAVSYDRPDHDLHRSVTRVLSGSPSPQGMELPQLAAEASLPYTVSRAGSEQGLKQLLRSYFDFDIQITSRVFSSYPLPHNSRLRLGQANHRLGYNAQLGSYYFTHNRKFRLILGPMDFKLCVTLLPGTERFACLNELVTFHLQTPQQYDIRFLIKASTMPAPRLDGSQSLGRSVFLPSHKQQEVRMLTINASRLWNSLHK
ncbi:MAG: type VI secretion system baseplate subunit TssG [Succinivibrio sp.]|nr:type VI secretion system baseplate subunit TssG [Succinivibrio sp.]